MALKNLEERENIIAFGGGGSARKEALLSMHGASGSKKSTMDASSPFDRSPANSKLSFHHKRNSMLPPITQNLQQ